MEFEMKIGLLGDYIVDQYIYGICDRLSPESPVPVFQETNRETRGGGVENVCQNLKALGAEIEYHFTQTSTKTRYVVDNHIVFRVDDESYLPINFTEYEFSSKIVILSDYNKGFLHRSADIIKHLKSRNKFVIVDPKKSLDNYRDADIVKLNEKEFSKYSEISDYEKARVQYSIGTIIVTRASKPVLIIDSKGISEVETTNYAVSDVTGAGDVFIASLGFYLAKGFDIKEATAKATRLASISVTKFGTYVLTEEDIRKVTPKIIFTNGCFDIIHRGHVEYLQKSKKLGDKLIVGLNSDKSVKSLKGFSRPVNNQADRKFVLESLGCVDEVIVFDEDTPYELIKRIKPDIITKGGDYTSIDQVVGHDLAQVKLIPFISGYSTTSILERA